ncbi:hypothetical protein [Clostridium sp. UBA5712]|uniref:hypothetical protein n=1 Tax=Clostridium sp. UBA5712 TaxID=1946368 RepID=UPI0032163E28
MDLYRIIKKSKKIEELISIEQDKIIEKIEQKVNEINNKLFKHYSYKEKINTTKEKIKEISIYIDQECAVALFIMKCNSKLRASKEKENFECYIEQSRIFSLMYSCISDAKNSNIILQSDDENVIKLYEWCVYYFYVSQKCNLEKNNLNYEDDKIKMYFIKIKEESMFPSSMYTYSLTNEELSKKVKEEKKDFNSLMKKVSRMNLCGISDIKETKAIFDRFCEFEREGYYFFNWVNLKHIVNRQLQKFIFQFCNINNRDTFSIDNDLIFAIQFESYGIIDFQYMYYVYDFIEKSLLWGHYEKLSNIIIEEKYKKTIKTINRDYNWLLNYYLADHLEANGYRLPYNGQKYPTIGIKKLKKNKVTGDIDVLVYSPFTKNILNIEYKNYQMTVQNEYYAESEQKRVIQDKVFEKIKRREEELRNNIIDVCDLLGISRNDVEDIKSIIVTTRLNLYLYMGIGKENCDYYAWYEFYQLVIEKKL